MQKQQILELVRQEVRSAVIARKEFIIAANWKMNKDKNDIIGFLKNLNKEKLENKNKIILFPPYPYLYLLEEQLRYSKALYGMQNIFWETSGAFTGEVSVEMALDFGCKYVIIGHSERRNILMETDEMAGKKVGACLQHGLSPVLCVGENLDERKFSHYKERIKSQIATALSQVDIEKTGKIILAYEPVWAIGTGMNASPEQVEEVHMFIRSVLDSLFGEKAAACIPILYGGSVKTSNVRDIAVAKDVSGFLIGGASLDFDEFKRIISLLDT